MKLDERDLAVLELLDAGPRPVADLAEDLGAPPAPLADRLADLADNDLVVERGDGRFERTESGRRVLVASPEGAMDNRIDTSPEVERALAEIDLGPDEADAVRSAFALVRYWGGITRAEITDAVYSETPAGYDSPDAWWTDCVRDALASLPDVEPPDSPDDPWRYDGVPEAADPRAEGRRMLDRDGPTFASVKQAVESLGLGEPEREAVHAAFSTLRQRGAATEEAIADAVYADHRAGYDSPESWWDGFLRGVFEELPHVERTDEGWTYRHDPTGSWSGSRTRQGRE